jgi:hypothetical protein
LVRSNIPARLNLIKQESWKDKILNMLQLIPDNLEEEEEEDNYILSIESRLDNYEYLQGVVAPILELAIWKSKISEQSNGDRRLYERMKSQCRCDSLTMVHIIIPNALSFL